MKKKKQTPKHTDVDMFARIILFRKALPKMSGFATVFETLSEFTFCGKRGLELCLPKIWDMFFWCISIVLYSRIINISMALLFCFRKEER